MLTVHHSNRVEQLLAALAETVARPVAEPLRPECIVIQNPGMGRWLAQQLALRTGIAANLELPLPARFFATVLRAWQPDAPAADAFDREALFWRLLRLVPELAARPDFAPVRRYLAAASTGAPGTAAPAAGGEQVALCQLCHRLADVFDKYLVYRPELVLDWERQGGDGWQARLWRAVSAEAGSGHRAARLAALAAAMGGGPALPGALPERVSLFGLTALAPVYMHLLGLLARHVEVHVFFMNPSSGYWGETFARRSAPARARGATGEAEAGGQAGAAEDAAALAAGGNPLLSSLGRVGQVFWQQLQDLNGTDDERFETPAGTHLLARIQRDVLELRDPGGESDGWVLAPDDDSIQVHSVHTPWREVQVLHNRLLRLFATLDRLEPRQVIVMAPDIGQYAPLVEAVFGTAPADQRIPWSIADARPAAAGPLAAAIERLLRLPRSRLEAGEVLELLQVPAVRRRFGVDEQGLERLRTWIRESGVRWGQSGAMRAELGLPADPANTWEFGLERLFLGYAMPAAASRQLYGQVLPYADVEGREVEYLGALQELVDALGRWRADLRTARSLAAWRADLDRLLGSFFAAAGEEEESLLELVRGSLEQLALRAAAAGFAGPLELEALRGELAVVLQGDGDGTHRFLTGAVTFCNMVPMRSIPFRVVALLGMGGTDFPRSQAPVSFDLMAQQPRRTDRSRRHDDRYLFLEALLSAREVLHISYVGRDVRDNSVRVPSVVISELLDYVERGYAGGAEGPGQGADLRQRLVLQHPLQPFSRRYFDGADPRLGTAAGHWLAAARAEVGPLPRFVPKLLPLPAPVEAEVALDQLVRFLRHPSRFFLQERLGLRLPEDDEPQPDEEPFDTAGLDRYSVQQWLQSLLESGCPRPRLEAWLRATGLVPPGTPGTLWIDEQMAVVQPFLARLERHRAAAGAILAEPVEVDWGPGPEAPAAAPGGWCRLRGRLSQVRARGCVEARLGKLRAADWLAAWARHLALNVAAPPSVEPRTVLVAREATVEFAPEPQAAALLADLLCLYREGLRGPVPLFPESAFSLVQKQRDLAAVTEAFTSERGAPGEGLDRAVRLVCRGVDPLGPAFVACAWRVVGPLAARASLVTAAGDRG